MKDNSHPPIKTRKQQQKTLIKRIEIIKKRKS